MKWLFNYLAQCCEGITFLDLLAVVWFIVFAALLGALCRGYL